MGLNIELLRTSFKMVSPKAEELSERFYQILFENNPELKPLFSKTNMKIQQKMLIEALATVMDLLDSPDKLKSLLFDMGRKHRGYGAVEEHFPAVGQALLKALAEIAGPAWNKELETAWAEAYGAIAGMMIEGLKAEEPVKV